MDFGDRMKRIIQERAELDAALAKEQAAEAERQRKRELEATDPFNNRRVPFSQEYRKFLADRIGTFTRYYNIFDREGQYYRTFQKYCQQYFQALEVNSWETKAFFLKTVLSTLENPRYNFILQGFAEYSLGGKVFQGDYLLYRAFCNALGYDPELLPVSFRDFMDRVIKGQLPQTELDWRLLTDPALKTQPTYDNSKMHPKEVTNYKLQDAFDTFPALEQVLSPDASEVIQASPTDN